MLNDADVILPHEEDPEELSSLAAEALDNCRYWDRRSIALAGKDGVRAAEMAAWSSRWSAKEAGFLRQINAFFLATGSVVGNEEVVRGRVYRINNPGSPATFLGAELPRDVIDGITAEEERREWAAEYRRSVAL